MSQPDDTHGCPLCNMGIPLTSPAPTPGVIVGADYATIERALTNSMSQGSVLVDSYPDDLFRFYGSSTLRTPGDGQHRRAAMLLYYDEASNWPDPEQPIVEPSTHVYERFVEKHGGRAREKFHGRNRKETAKRRARNRAARKARR